MRHENAVLQSRLAQLDIGSGHGDTVNLEGEQEEAEGSSADGNERSPRSRRNIGSGREDTASVPQNWPYVRAIIISFLRGNSKERLATSRVLRMALPLTDSEAATIELHLRREAEAAGGLLSGIFG